MKKLDILHISDIHIQKKDCSDIVEIVNRLIEDVLRLQEHKNITFDLICFTGDLIQRGDKAIEDEKQWDLGLEILVKPLLKELKLPFSRFIFVPGNHEVDTKRIDPVIEKGLERGSLEEINKVIKNFNSSYRERLSYFYEVMEKQGKNITFGKLGYSYKEQINELNVGIACVDSAWRSSGKGVSEKGKLYVSPIQIQELFGNISDCDIKICMMHHPIDWLEECECLEVERELGKFDVVLRGHVHEEDLKQVVRNSIKTIYSTAGKLYPLDYLEGHSIDGYNGYSALNIDYQKGKCNIYIRSYYGKNRKEFDAGINICSNGEVSFNMFSRGEWQQEFDVIKGIKSFFDNMSEKYAMIRKIDSQFPKDFMQILVEPVLNDKSEYVKEKNVNEKEIKIRDIVLSNDNIFLIGKKEIGKTTILQQIGLNYINEYEQKGIIPIYI